MRVQTIVAFWLLLLAIADASFAKQLKEFKRHTELKKLTKIPAAASPRSFHPQGSDSDYTPASNNSVCLEAGFRALVNATLTSCGDQVFNDSLPPTVEAHRAAWNAFCDSPCATVVHAAVASKYWVCLQPALQYETAETDYLCSNKDSHSDFCGLAISRIRFTSSCIIQSKSSDCVKFGSGACRWSEDGCEINGTQPLFDAMCGSCITGLNKNVYAKYQSQSDAAWKLYEYQDRCSRAPNGAYCRPVLAAVPSDSFDSLFESNTQMASLCQNDAEVACVSRYLGDLMDLAFYFAQFEFVYCANGWNNVSSAVTQKCLPSFLDSVAAVQTLSTFLGAMCTSFNGTYCVPAFSALSNVTEGKDGCPSNAAATVTKLGCCLGTVQSMWDLIRTRSNDTSLIPRIPGYTPPPIQQTLPPAPATQRPVVLAPGEELSPNPGNGGFFNLAACGVTGLNESLRVRCAQNRFEFSKNLLLKLNYAAVTATPAMKEAFMMALRRDVARNAKVSPTQITDDSISATDRVQVTTASGHGMQVQGTASGVQYSYTIQASNKAWRRRRARTSTRRSTWATSI